MIINNLKTLVFLATLLVMLPGAAKAQSYATIDDDLGLYCADLPDGTNSLVRIAKNGGLYTTKPVDPKDEKKAIVKLRKDLQKRINTLNNIKGDYDPSEDIQKLKQTYKFIADEILTVADSDSKLDGLRPSRIHNKISQLVGVLRKRLSELQSAIETIDRCMNDEDLIPPPTAPSAEAIFFPFYHPDYGTKEVMRGLGVTAILHKSRYYGSVCVGAAKARGRIPVFPKEAEFVVNLNPCLMFFQTAFRNYPFCHYGTNKYSAVGWFSTTDAGFSQSAVTQSEINGSNNTLAFYGPFHVRVPTKKKPCRK